MAYNQAHDLKATSLNIIKKKKIITQRLAIASILEPIYNIQFIVVLVKILLLFNGM